MAEPIFYVKTLQVKVRSGQAWLNTAAREVNFVWNWCNETSAKAWRPYYGKGKWLSGYDLNRLASGTSKEFANIGSDIISQVCMEYATNRSAAQSLKLKWRASGGSRRALGWLPFKYPNVKFKDGAIIMLGHRFRIFDSYGLDQYQLRAGNFAQNALGEWFLNIDVRMPLGTQEIPASAIGIDLGLKTTATCSDGFKLEGRQFYRGIEPKIQEAQRRGHKRQAKRLHLKAKNRRKDALHKFSTLLVRQHGCIYVGDVSSTKLARTRMAKSTLDAGWYMLKTMLHSKGHRAGRIVEVVDECNTTRVCSKCGCVSGPAGLKQLGVRQWDCGDCGESHDRDVNSALNILSVGLGRKPPFAGKSNVD